MKNVIIGLYTSLTVVFFIFLTYMFLTQENRVLKVRDDSGYNAVENYSYERREAKSAPLGVYDIYSIKLEEISKGGDALVFYSIHQTVKVYIEDGLVYNFNIENSISSTPGNKWNVVPLYSDDVGKEIRVELTPVYGLTTNVNPTFYAGKQTSIYLYIIRKSLPVLILAIAAVIAGILFMAFVVYNFHNSEVDKGLFMLGQFSVQIGLWKMADTDVLMLFADHVVGITYVSYLTLLLLVVPYTMYIRKIFSTADSLIWDIPCFFNLGVGIISLVFQLIGIADFRQMLWVNHLSMLLLLVIAVSMAVYEVHKVGWNKKLKLTAFCMALCMTGLIADLVIYYSTEKAAVTVIGMIGFLVYILVLGLMSVREAKQLMSIGMQAKHFEEMAYHDQLTGLFNRTAYADYTESGDFTPVNSVVVMLDLNNLKQCNDNYGHEKGDLYITSSAKIIENVFGNAGRCFRMGGDEFCVLLKHHSLKNCERLVSKMHKEVADWNRTHHEKFRMQIASGYARYDSKEDYNLGDTLRRADKMMYRDKFELKQKAAGA